MPGRSGVMQSPLDASRTVGGGLSLKAVRGSFYVMHCLIQGLRICAAANHF